MAFAEDLLSACQRNDGIEANRSRPAVSRTLTSDAGGEPGVRAEPWETAAGTRAATPAVVSFIRSRLLGSFAM